VHILVLFLILFASSIFGQVTSPPWTPPGANFRPTTSTFSYDAGLNHYNKDTYLYLAPGLNFNYEKWGISFQVPLNILLVDHSPKIPNSKPGMLRPRDYDQKSDYAKLLNYVYYGKYGDYQRSKVTYSVFAGRLFDGYIGHGTIIGRYVNNQSIDQYKIGTMADINTDYGGVQVFTNNVVDRNELNAARGYIRPYGIARGIMNLFSNKSEISMLAGKVLDEGRNKVGEEVNEEKDSAKKPVKANRGIKPDDEENNSDSIFYRFAIGYTSAADGKAPSQLNYDTTGHLKYDNQNNISVNKSKRRGIEGYDAEFKIISMEYFELTPYFDYNRIKGLDNSRGRHYGAIAKIGTRNINLTIKPEFRRMSSNYIPIYFDSFYEIERYQYNLDVTGSLPITKEQFLESKNSAASPQVSGYYHTIILNVYNIGLEASYEDYSGKNNSRVFMGLYVPFSIFRISGFYTKKNFDKQQQAFKLDDKAQGVIEFAASLGPITLKLQDRRRWIYDATTNQFQAKDEQMILFSGGANF
jgi:hypothetical protein